MIKLAHGQDGYTETAHIKQQRFIIGNDNNFFLVLRFFHARFDQIIRAFIFRKDNADFIARRKAVHAGLSVKDNGHLIAQTSMRPVAFDKSDQPLAAVLKTFCGEIGISLDEVVPVDQEV